MRTGGTLGVLYILPTPFVIISGQSCKQDKSGQYSSIPIGLIESYVRTELRLSFEEKF